MLAWLIVTIASGWVKLIAAIKTFENEHQFLK